MRFRDLRRDIARLHTILREKEPMAEQANPDGGSPAPEARAPAS